MKTNIRKPSQHFVTTFWSKVGNPVFWNTFIPKRFKMDSSRLDKITDIIESSLPPHHRVTKSLFHGRFQNPWPTWEERTFSDMMRWNKERRAAGFSLQGRLSFNPKPSPADFLAAFPPVTPDAAALAKPPAEAIQAFWIGHASILVQVEGFAFLTDPVFAERCSPISFLGPKRVIPPALTATSPELPHIDAVVISHNHYDHLCKSSIRALYKRFGDNMKFYVPLGLSAWFHKLGIKNVIEMDWYDEVEHASNLKVVFTPAQHWTMRTGFDRKASLWGGWALLGKSNKFWFAGDTGYCPVFKEIGERFGGFDLSAIPTGAYSPRWFMRPQHTNPGDAVLVHQDVKSKRSFAIHLATFSLTDENMDEPVKLLEEEKKAHGLSHDEFVTLRHGAHIVTTGGRDLNKPALLKVVKP